MTDESPSSYGFRSSEPADLTLHPDDMPPELKAALANMSKRGPVVNMGTGETVALDGRLLPEPVPPRVNGQDEQRPASQRETERAQSTAARIGREVTEMREAAERLAAGGPFEQAVGEFITVQATMLERAGGTAVRADSMNRDQDTVEQPGMFPTPARSALLMARALGNSG